MDLKVADIIFDGVCQYNDSCENNYGNTICKNAPSGEISYPITIFREVSNTQNRNYNSDFDRVSSVSYSVDIYAKNKGEKVPKRDVARHIAEQLDKYFTGIGLIRENFVVYNVVNDNSTYHITLVYSANLHENSRRFI